MTAPWRALRRGHHDQAGDSPEKVDPPNIPYVGEKIFRARIFQGVAARLSIL